MKKALLEQFIAKYNLASGDVENAKWAVDASDDLVVRFTSADESCFGYIKTKVPGLPQGEYYVANTGILRSMLGVLGDEITVSVKVNSAKAPIALLVTDKQAKVSFPLGDSKIGKKHRNAAAPVDPNDVLISIPLVPSFSQAFLRAKSALKDVDTFTVVSDGKTVDVVVGYEARGNSNKVTLSPEATRCATFDATSYQNKYLAEILTANKDIATGTLMVMERDSNPPFIRIHFETPEFICTYILVKVME